MFGLTIEMKDNLYILLMGHTLQGLSIKMFEERGKLKLDIMFFKIENARCPNLHCQSDKIFLDYGCKSKRWRGGGSGN